MSAAILWARFNEKDYVRENCNEVVDREKDC
jgi:hypothetical protein